MTAEQTLFADEDCVVWLKSRNTVESVNKKTFFNWLQILKQKKKEATTTKSGGLRKCPTPIWPQQVNCQDNMTSKTSSYLNDWMGHLPMKPKTTWLLHTVPLTSAPELCLKVTVWLGLGTKLLRWVQEMIVVWVKKKKNPPQCARNLCYFMHMTSL